ncbi:MAG: class I tRNA ligase family protein, partial [Chitinophagaceae bacterium]
PHRVPVEYVDGIELNIDQFIQWQRNENTSREFLYEKDGKFLCGVETEKMSKSKYNTVNPDVLIDKYGADTFRMYEMFLGPVEASKPWDTKGIEGVHRFLKKLWRLFYDDVKGKVWTEENPADSELKVLHKTIKKIEEDTERFSYNTAVSAFMVCVNELHDLKCHKKEILEMLLILLTPYAPHVSEELWHHLNSLSFGEGGGEVNSILDASFPTFDPKYLIESSKEYPISINGKMRTVININLDATEDDVKKIVLENEVMKKWIEDKPIKKLIFVKNKMVNVVL